MQNLAQALANFHGEVGKILKLSDAQYGKYADLATVLGAVAPVLSKHGLAVTQTFMPFEFGASTCLLRTTLMHSSGESVNSDLLMPSTDGQRNALHAFGAATTYLRRYALLALLNLAAEDDDGQSFGQEQSEEIKPVAKAVTGTQPKPHKRTVSGGASVTPARLTDEAKADVIEAVKAVGTDAIPVLCDAFRKRFGLADGVQISDYIKTQAHSDFINEWIAANATTPVPA